MASSWVEAYVVGSLFEHLLEVVVGLLGFARPSLQLAGQHSGDCQPASDSFQRSLRLVV